MAENKPDLKVSETISQAEKAQWAVLESAPTAMLVSNAADGKVIFGNRRLSQLLDIPLEELIGMATPDFYADPEDRKTVLAAVKEDGHLEDFELQIKRLDGTPIWVILTIELIQFEGQPALLSSLTDITDLKKAEINSATFDALFKNSSDAYLFIEDGVFTDCNDAAIKMLKADSKVAVLSLEPAQISPLHQPDGKLSSEKQVALIQKAFEEGNIQFEWIHRDINGIDFPVEVTLTAIRVGERELLSVGWRNITERKRREERTRIFQTLALNSADAIMISDLDGKVTFANQAAYELLGYDFKQQEMTGISLAALAPEEERARQGEAIQMLMTGGDNFSNEARAVCRDGSVVDVDITMFPLSGEDGRPVGAAAILRDVTERKQAEAKLSENEERFRRFTEATLEGLVFHEQGQIVDANPAALAMFGLSRDEEFVGKSLLEFLVPESHEMVLKQMQLETVLPYEVVCIHKDGSAFPAETSTRTYKLGDRTIRATSVRDITERKQAETEILQERNFSDAIINSLPGIFYMFDTQGKLIRRNKNYETVVGYSAGEIATRNALDAVAEEDRERVAQAIQMALSEGRVELEVLFQTLKGEKIPYFMTAVRMIIGDDMYVMGTGLDLSERKRLEADVQSAFERRGYQVQVSTEIAQEISTATELSELLERVVTLIKERLGYYHSQLLRYVPSQDAVVLVSGYGEIGEKMLAQGHRITLGSGLIGTAAESGETVMRPDLTEDSDWASNPLLPETRGEIAVPIKQGDEILGVLDVQSDRAGALTDDDRLLLEGLCGQIAIAIGQTRLRQEMASRLEEINRLYQAMSREGWKSYTASGGLPHGFVYDEAGLHTLEDEKLDRLLTPVIEKSQSLVPGPGQPLMAAPLSLLGGSTVGALGAYQDSSKPLSDEEQQLLEQVAEQVALALETARLFDEARTAEAVSTKRAGELAMVAEVGTTVSTILDEKQLLQTVVTLTQRRFEFYHCHMFLMDKEEKELKIAACGWEENSPHEGTTEEVVIPLSSKRSLVAQAARSRQSVIVNEVRRDKNWLPNELLPQTEAEMAVPLVVGDTVLGVLDVQAVEVGRFDKSDINIMTTLAAQVAVALQNTRLYVEQAETVAQLRELDRLKSSFLANMSHELRTPLNSILGFADVMLEELDGPLTENMSNDLSIIQKNGQHLLHLINDVLDMAKIESGKMNLVVEEFNLDEIIEEVTNITSTLASEKNLALYVEPESESGLVVTADRTRLRQVMINLINNAIKFTDQGKISINTKRVKKDILISVRDTGVGIPKEQLEVIFQEFTQVDDSMTRKVGGTGLGLPISRRLIELHGGALWAESSGAPGEGSTFFVKLPIEAQIVDMEVTG
ncbi:MAG: PAS domain S-box protein [Anaerolineales bacterium]|nr:PAS domain S-box protein [Anaerolineales bacterium]